MVKPKKQLSSLTFVIITSKVKTSLLSNCIGIFKLNLMLRLKGNEGWAKEYLLTSSQSWE